MTNPATTLLTIFQNWTGASNEVAIAIRGFHEDPAEAWSDHEAAILAIAEIAHTLDSLENQGRNVRALRSGVLLSMKAVMNFPHSWQQAGGAPETMNQHLFDVVGSLEAFLDGQMLTLSPVGVANVEDLLTQVINGLDDDPSLSAQLKAHILKVVQTIRNCIEEYGLTGETDLRQAMEDLWVSLFAAAGATTDEKRGFWQNLSEKVGYPAAATALGALPAMAMDFAQLTQS